MHIAPLAAAALLSIGSVAQAHPPSPVSSAPARQGQQPVAPAPQQPVAPAPQQPGPTTPQQLPPTTTQPPAPTGTAPVVVAPALPVAPLGARTFTAKTGMIFNSVRPERVLDFETVIGLLKNALEKSTDPTVRKQAEGWRVFKATEPGPNGTVTYVFVFDPAVPGADYGLGRILADAYPEKIQEIWKLYTGALSGGGSLLNLTPVPAPLPVLPETIPAPTTISPSSARPGPPPAGSTPPAQTPPVSAPPDRTPPAPAPPDRRP